MEQIIVTIIYGIKTLALLPRQIEIHSMDIGSYKLSWFD